MKVTDLYSDPGEPEVGQTYDIQDQQGRVYNNTNFRAEFFMDPSGEGERVEVLHPGQSTEIDADINSVKFWR
ncbi:hypothetical protein AB0C96_40670 [Streptomyces sp. NPDC048506]|uniref:hypothetical protein n=1 Tax=Streptomyces sp. NPDC048506 TaxID=3155028 RepID=UPI0034176DA1